MSMKLRLLRQRKRGAYDLAVVQRVELVIVNRKNPYAIISHHGLMTQ